MSSEKKYLDVLQHNGDFKPVEKWLNFATSNNFEKVAAVTRGICPECQNKDLNTVGQYIYYSNRIEVKFCNQCNLYFSNKLINAETIKQHFEKTYKDEQYFTTQRKPIFDHIASIADKLTPENGQVIDIGGGKGHLLNTLQKIRPDIDLTLNDLSEESCRSCEESYDIKSICSDIPGLASLGKKFNTVLLIDVIYYEPELHELFKTIDKLLDKENSSVIIRIPNKLPLIKLRQFILNLFGSEDAKFYQHTLKHFNPEHIYIFSQRYLRGKLKQLGFKDIAFMPTPLLNKTSANKNFIGNVYFCISNIISKLTMGRIILTASMVVVAKK